MNEEIIVPEIANHKHKAFVDFYLQDPERNMREAYKKVYGDKMKDRAADASAIRLLHSANIANYIQAVEKVSTNKVHASLEWTLEKLIRFANAQITDYFTVTRSGRLKLKNLESLTQEMIDCIQEIKQSRNGEITIKLIDKRGSVEDIGRHFGLFRDEINLNHSGNVAQNVYIIPAFQDTVSVPKELDEVLTDK